jgi:hypothetical protein
LQRSIRRRQDYCRVAPHNAVAAVAAHVEERVQPALSVARQDDRVFAHVGVEEIIRPGHQALVPDLK